jgi:hypothetical protein
VTHTPFTFESAPASLLSVTRNNQFNITLDMATSPVVGAIVTESIFIVGGTMSAGRIEIGVDVPVVFVRATVTLAVHVDSAASSAAWKHFPAKMLSAAGQRSERV